MKNFLKTLLISVGIFFAFNFLNTSAVGVDFNTFDGKSAIESASIAKSAGGSFDAGLYSMTKNILKILKVIIGGLLVIYIVYSGLMMIIFLGDSEEKLGSAKKGLWYALIGLLFINIPGSLYEAFTGKQTTDSVTGSIGNVKNIYSRNIFVNTDVFGTVLGSILTFLQILVVAICVFVLVLQGIKLIVSRGHEEVRTEAIKKILYSLGGLVFIGIMAVWKNVVFMSDISGGKELFATLANLALYFAGPVAIFFLSLAGYYYITSGGNDDKIKKAKNIVINTAFATLILLGMYTILLELKTFKL